MYPHGRAPISPMNFFFGYHVNPESPLGMTLALGYFVFVYRMFRGKVSAEGTTGYAE